jgi:hypothetical protein
MLSVKSKENAYYIKELNERGDNLYSLLSKKTTDSSVVQ